MRVDETLALDFLCDKLFFVWLLVSTILYIVPISAPFEALKAVEGLPFRAIACIGLAAIAVLLSQWSGFSLGGSAFVLAIYSAAIAVVREMAGYSNPVNLTWQLVLSESRWGGDGPGCNLHQRWNTGAQSPRNDQADGRTR